ncbi:uncharacterized protein METZ01_LOCUS331925 [marine metagenome]|uniref:Uncharacterized protein n=1 Tax=marine metagenome TaxID=408172 RepID=A0A382Q4A2_9ZZZZ
MRAIAFMGHDLRHKRIAKRASSDTRYTYPPSVKKPCHANSHV